MENGDDRRCKRISKHSATLRRIERGAAELEAAVLEATADDADHEASAASAIIWQEPALADMPGGNRALSLHWVAWSGHLRLGLRIARRDEPRRPISSFIFRKRDAVRLARLAMAALANEQVRRAEFVAMLKAGAAPSSGAPAGKARA